MLHNYVRGVTYGSIIVLAVQLNDSKRLRPGANKAHTKGPEEDKQAGVDSLPAAEITPAGVAQKVFREELDERCKGQEAS